MPQEQERRYRPPTPGQPESEPEERKKTPADNEIDKLIDEADEIVKRNKENQPKRQPSRQ